MKRITIVAGGSLGDVKPMAVLAKALSEIGYSVRFACSQVFASLLNNSQVELYILERENDPRSVVKDDWKAKETKQWQVLRRLVSATPPSKILLAELQDACKNADVLVCNFVSSAISHVAESRRVPIAIIFFAPFYPTRRVPVPMGPPISLGGSYNLLTHKAVEYLRWRANRKWINEWRTEDLGLPSVSESITNWMNKHGVVRVFAFSPALLPKPDDWGPSNHVTGFLFDDEDHKVDIPPELRNFVRCDRPVISVGFGSHKPANMKYLLSCLRNAVKKVDCRAIFLGLETPLNSDEASPNEMFVPFAPHQWIFQNVSLAIHAAGCATVAEVLRAGIPSVPIPLSGDQKFWSNRLFRVGAASRPVHLGKVDSEHLALLIQSALQSSNMRAKATEISHIVNLERGLDNAISAIEKLFGAGR